MGINYCKIAICGEGGIRRAKHGIPQAPSKPILKRERIESGEGGIRTHGKEIPYISFQD